MLNCVESVIPLKGMTQTPSWGESVMDSFKRPYAWQDRAAGGLYASYLRALFTMMANRACLQLEGRCLLDNVLVHKGLLSFASVPGLPECRGAVRLGEAGAR
jgi:hypothetical protein